MPGEGEGAVPGWGVFRRAIPGECSYDPDFLRVGADMWCGCTYKISARSEHGKGVMHQGEEVKPTTLPVLLSRFPRVPYQTL